MGERKGRPGLSKRGVEKMSSPAHPQKENGQATSPPPAGDTHYHGLFERLPVGLYRATPAGQIVDVNPAFIHMLGYPDREAVMAINARDLYVDPGDRARLMAVLEREGVVVDFESQLRGRDGALLWVRAYARAVRDVSGMVEYFEGGIIDVTERKLARETLQKSEERFQVVARATNDLVWDWDLLTNKGWRGPGAHSLFGYTGDLARPWPEWWSENIHPEDRERVLSSIRAAISGGEHTWSSEYRFRRANGYYAYVSDRGYVIRDATQRPVRMVGAMMDITDHKEAEEEIRRRTAHLEALNAIIASAVASADLGDLLAEAIDRTVKALDARMGGIWVGDLHIDRGLPPEVGPLFARAREIAGLDRSVVVSDWRDPSGPVADVLAPIAARLNIWASLSAPLEKDGRIFGGLAIGSPQFRTWLPEEITLVEAVGKQVGAAVERLRLFGEAQRRASLMGQLVALVDTLNRPLTVAEVTPAIGEAALTLSGADRAAVFLRQEEGVMACAWSRGLSSRYIAEVLAHHKDLPSGQLMKEGAELDRFTLPGGRVIEGKKPFLFSDVHSLPHEAVLRALAESEGYRALGNWPLTYEGRVIGLVSCYYDAPRTWSEAEQEVFLAFCLQAAVALQNVHLHEAQAQRTAELEAFYARVTEVMKTEGGKP